jgi:hypothetical protein
MSTLAQERRRKKEYLRGHLDRAQATALETQAKNTAKAYKKPQRDFKVSLCLVCYIGVCLCSLYSIEYANFSPRTSILLGVSRTVI